MKRKIMTLVMALSMTVGLLAGCGNSQSVSKADTLSGDGKTLNIMIWGDTISEDVISNFEKENNIKVNVSYIDSTDSLLAKMVNSSENYDAISIESAYVKTFVDADLLRRIDKSKITSLDDYDPVYNKGFVGDEDMEYTVPASGPIFTTVTYNKETCPIKIKSFKDLADPSLKGKIAMVNSTISLYGTALAALGYKPDTMNEDEIKQANDLLEKIKKNVKTFSGTSATSQMENGDVCVSFGWDYPTLCSMSEDNWTKFADASLNSPVEESIGYMAIPKNAENVDGALKFINYIISPESQAASAKEFGGMPATSQEKTEKYLPNGYYDNPAMKENHDLASDSSKYWQISINDDQISILDNYYTELMADK